ncbi:alpha-L-rhamnosidase C-terminal domain-containing protein [Cohnella sp. GbtcB17]|uniref:alpha-L-rhamnosidase-related protein n=1 Tax=Cohnella sp. GbtcB17 TaxID=2824762 RepID=UPI001C2F9047|nr:alpha-L-rhamnosidase C-terminal domain-containing protein [Cohnella sp. GbtcB17]
MSDRAAIEAVWIWMEERQVIQNEQVHEQIYFRRSFELDRIEEATLQLKVSADSRYRLYVNGIPVSRGPAKGDHQTYYYEEVDCTSFLREGRNVIAAHVVHYGGREGPVSVWRANRGGFLLSGEVLDQKGQSILTLHTDERWRCLQETAIAYDVSDEDTAFVGGTERADGRNLAHNWYTMEYDDSDWYVAVKVSRRENPVIGHFSPWYLAPRPIPPLYETNRAFIPSFGPDDIGKPITIGPHQNFKLELDAGEMTTGYPVLWLSSGKNASVKLLYAECYQQIDPATGAFVKGIRDDRTGVLIGNFDLYTVGGFGSTDQPECYEPFLFRTFRYVSLEVETADEALTIQSFHYRETGYPLEVKASFTSSDASLQPLWNISINTLKRCMHETYEDCPYFEQLQYAMDTRLQALFTYQLSGDDRLARKAIYDFHCSRLPNGMLQSRYPSMLQQVIPGFSLYWIMMVHDHYRYFGDLTLVRTYLPTIDGVLEWFHQRIASDGLLDQMPPEYWSYVDWVDEWRELSGVPTASKEGSMVIYNMMYAASLKLAAELQDALGRTGTGDDYRSRAAALIEAVNQTGYSEAAGLYQDAPRVELYSQHAQIWAVLAGAVQGEAARQLIERMLANQSLSKVSYAMSFFLFRALEEIDAYDQSFSLWDTWRDLAALGLTSWVEDPVSQRSDCHAWGAVPIYEFSAKLLGVSPATPGYSTIKVAPQPGKLTYASGDVATPQGVVHVAWELRDGKQFNLTVSTSVDAKLMIVLPDRSVHVHQGGEELHFSCTLL